jgi:hypothetical protein
MDKLLRISCMLSDKLIDGSNEKRITPWGIKQPEESCFGFARASGESIDDKVMFLKSCNRIHLVLQWERHNLAYPV